MIVTPKLQEHFDSNREVNKDTLDYLLSLGIDERFAEQCKSMFDGIKADIEEVIDVSPYIKEENSRLELGLLQADIRKKGILLKAANDDSYLDKAA